MKLPLLISILFFSVISFAQDILFKQSGEEIEVKVLKVNRTNVMYKKYSDLEGKTYVMDKVHLFMIKYEDGRKETFTGEDKKIEENGLRQGLRIGLHVTPANMKELDIISLDSYNPEKTISGGLDIYYYFSDNVAIKTGVIVNAIPNTQNFDIQGNQLQKPIKSYVNLVGIPIKIVLATGDKIGFYFESGTTLFFKQIQNTETYYNGTMILQDIVTGIHYSPSKLISVHAGPSLQFNFGRSIAGVQAGISFGFSK